MPSSSRATAYIVIVNWNGWRDTIECLESVLRLDHPNYRVVVCDNASDNGSAERIIDWANGEIAATPAADERLARLVEPALPKPIPVRRFTRAAAERGGNLDRDVEPLVLIDVGENLGFAGACNVGIRYATRDPSCEYIWLLNNDTVVEPNALSALVERLEAQPRAGQCGSRLLRYRDPTRIEALGGEQYVRWSGATRPVGAGHDAASEVDVGAIERRLSYVGGASLCVTRRFVERVGLMEESYFLYFEEIDWARRGGSRFALAYAHESVVYHKHGQSTGGDGTVRRSLLADFFVQRNRLAFTRRHFPLTLPAVWAHQLLTLLGCVLTGRRDRAGVILRAMLSPSAYFSSVKFTPSRVLVRYSRRPAGDAHVTPPRSSDPSYSGSGRPRSRASA